MKECLICKRVFGDHIERCDYDHSPLKHTLPGIPIINSKYRLDERIGQGSLGIVYKGARIGYSEPLAIKLIHPEFCLADANVSRVLMEEVGAVCQLQHPNIARIVDYGHTNSDSLFIAMEYLQGCTLQSVIEQEPEIPIERTIELMDQICDAVGAVHKAGHLHWDIRPSTIFITYGEDGREQAKMLDFGLARLKTMELCNMMPGARTSNLLSLPYYFSPEQCDGLDITARSEIYSLGVILYQMLTGKLPFQGTTYLQVMNQHISQPPIAPRSIRPNIPEALEATVLRALAKTPQERFPSTGGFATMLKMTLMSPAKPAPQFNQTPNIQPVNPQPVQMSANQIQERPVISYDQNSLRHGEGWEILEYMARLMDSTLISRHLLSHNDLDPDTIITQIAEQLESRRVQHGGDWYVPNLIKIYVPRTQPEKFRELESIFNSHSFVGNIYKYVRKMDYRLFNLLKVEVEMVNGNYNLTHPTIVFSWPSANDVSNGLEKIVEVKQQKIVSTQLPTIEISRFALLQPINAAAYHEHYLIVRAATNLGRFRNVLDHASGQLLRRNDLPFLQPVQPDSPNNTISRQHAKIEFINGEFYLFDIGSTNGTRINRREKLTRFQIPVEPNGDGALLHDRDIIQLGLALISFEIVPEYKIAQMAEQFSAQQNLQMPAPGSTADIFRTAVVTTSLTTALVW